MFSDPSHAIAKLGCCLQASQHESIYVDETLLFVNTSFMSEVESP
jgi:hypothetical protein